MARRSLPRGGAGAHRVGLRRQKQEALPAGSALTVRILDIGQGDAMLLSKDGEWALIDSGDVDHRPDMKSICKTTA